MEEFCAIKKPNFIFCWLNKSFVKLTKILHQQKTFGSTIEITPSSYYANLDYTNLPSGIKIKFNFSVNLFP